MEAEGKLFTPDPDRTFVKPVTFKVPTKSGGETAATLRVTYKSVPRDQLKTMQEELDDDSVYDEVVVGVDNVGDGQGRKLELAEGKTAMAQESAFVYEAVLEYYNVMFGGNLKPKTSRKRRATG